jgi:hypothetical protein
MINTVFLIYTQRPKIYARHKKRSSCFNKLDVLCGELEASSNKNFPLIFLISNHFSNSFAAEKRTVRVQKKIVWSNTNKTRKSLCLGLAPMFDMFPALCIQVRCFRFGLSVPILGPVSRFRAHRSK